MRTVALNVKDREQGFNTIKAAVEPFGRLVFAGLLRPS